MAAKPLPTVDRLRQLLDYCPESGTLIWLERTPDMFGRVQDCLRWNTCFAGRVAGSIGALGYLHLSVFDHKLYGHRVAWALACGDWPDGEIDHINGDRSDNRFGNLRCVSHETNLRNMRLNPRSSSGCVGVYLHENGRFRAIIGGKGHRRNLGYFDTLEEAANARKAAERRMGYHCNHGVKSDAA